MVQSQLQGRSPEALLAVAATNRVPMSTTSQKRLIYLVQTRDHALYQGIYSAVSFVLGAGCLHWSPFLGYTLWVIAIYFFVGWLMNLLAYRRHKKAVQASESTAASVESDEIDVDEVVQDIDLGAQEGVIRFIYSNNLAATHRESLEKIRESIVKDKEGFARKFADFVADNMRKYPKYASFISGLKIQSIRIFRAKGKGQCIASVRFAGDVGDVWGARYTGEAFSELIWN